MSDEPLEAQVGPATEYLTEPEPAYGIFKTLCPPDNDRNRRIIRRLSDMEEIATFNFGRWTEEDAEGVKAVCAELNRLVQGNDE